jgi:hypothetical protein
MKEIKSLISFSLIFAFVYLIMCPFAQTLTPGTSSPVLIPQNQVAKNIFRQKDLITPSLHYFPKNQIEIWTDDNESGVLLLITHQNPVFRLFKITTTRLII